jgi:hypothetical protein
METVETVENMENVETWKKPQRSLRDVVGLQMVELD